MFGSPQFSKLAAQEESPMKTISSMTGSVITTAKNITHSGAVLAGKTVLASAEVVGMKDKIEYGVHGLERAAKSLAKKGKTDALKAANKARRLANKAFDFDEEEGSTDTTDFDLLLSTFGAMEKVIPMRDHFSKAYNVPPGCKFAWKARVKRGDISFVVKEQKDNDGMVEIEPFQKYKADSQIQGIINESKKPRKLTITFDNTNSLQSKTIAYWIAIGENVTLQDDAKGAARSKEFAAAEEGPME